MTCDTQEQQADSEGSCAQKDLARSLLSTVLLWGLPAAAFLGGFFAAGDARTALWAGALLVAGSACLVNARGCGRLHCYFTGPWFLLCAGVVVLAHAGVVILDSFGWNLLGAVTIVGGTLLYVVPEYLWGRYRARVIVK